LERSGKQELIIAQRNAAADKKKLEATVAHLESRIRMLEQVINNTDLLDVQAASSEAAINEDSSSPSRTNLTVSIADESEVLASSSSSSDGGSPSSSSSISEAEQRILQLQQENHKLAEAKLSAQFRCKRHLLRHSIFVFLVKSQLQCHRVASCIRQSSRFAHSLS
jgi:hypothetical protein